MERVCNSGARVAQGEGPYHISFKRTEEDEYSFVQIDGEAVKIKQLQEVVIRRHPLMPKRGVRVLRGSG